MPNRTSSTGSELFIVDNSDTDWKVLKYLHDWCRISKAVDIATFTIKRIVAGQVCDRVERYKTQSKTKTNATMKNLKDQIQAKL